MRIANSSADTCVGNVDFGVFHFSYACDKQSGLRTSSEQQLNCFKVAVGLCLVCSFVLLVQCGKWK